VADRYHINPETGKPGICRAEIKCRFGAKAEHYATKEEARGAFEEVVKNSAELFSTIKKAEVANHTSACCKSCGAPVTVANHAKLLTTKKSPVCACGSTLTVSKIRLEVRPESESLLTIEGARATTFYHATVRRNWGSSLTNSDRLIHMGEKDAAVDRALTWYNNRPSPTTVWALYELRLKKRATMGKKLTDSGVDIADKLPNPRKGDYHPYVNRYEAPGSVSAVVPASAVEIVSVRPIRFQELYEAPSLYNLHEEMKAAEKAAKGATS
jgi:hypothetical protein